MRPDQRWFPTNRIDRAAWFRNFSTQFSQIGISLGFTQAEIDAVNADNAVLQYTTASLTQMDALMRSLRAFEQVVTMDANNSSEPNFPVISLPAPPAMVAAGIFERLERLVRRIRCAPAFTPDRGALLGIDRVNARIADPQNFVPTFKAAAVAEPYSLSVRCAVRLFNGFEVSISRKDSAVWENAGSFYSSPATITITPATPGVPEQVNVRVRMIKANFPATPYSGTATVTVNP